MRMLLVLMLTGVPLMGAGNFIEFDAIGSVDTVATAINNAGQVVGYYYDQSRSTHGFLRDPQGNITEFNVPGARHTPFHGTRAYAVNAGGEVVGSFDDTNGTHGFLRDASGQFTTFDYPGTTTGTAAIAINNSGTILGSIARDSAYAFLRDSAGRYTLIAAPNSACGTVEATRTSCTMAMGLNSAGDVVGFEWAAQQGDALGFMYSSDEGVEEFQAPGSGTFANLGTFATAINDRGQITGYYDASSALYSAFIRTGSDTFTEFQVTLNGNSYSTISSAINVAGAVTGQYLVLHGQTNVPHGYIRAPSGQITVFDAPAGEKGTRAYSINDSGSVTGVYTDAQGVEHAFLRR